VGGGGGAGAGAGTVTGGLGAGAGAGAEVVPPEELPEPECVVVFGGLVVLGAVVVCEVVVEVDRDVEPPVERLVVDEAVDPPELAGAEPAAGAAAAAAGAGTPRMPAAWACRAATVLRSVPTWAVLAAT
jgi:hypothetical protein